MGSPNGSTFLFTYQQDAPRIVTPVIATSLAYDQGLYIATDFTVENFDSQSMHYYSFLC